MKTKRILLILLLALLLSQPVYADGGGAAMPVISVQPADQSLSLGESCTLSVSAAVSDGGTLSYMWCSSATADMSGMSAIGGGSETGSSLTVTPAAGTVYYCVMVTNTLGENVTSLYSRIASVTVRGEGGEIITGIEVAVPPARLQYNAGDTLDSTGLVLRLLTDAGSREVITGYTCHPTALTQAGTQTITVSYGVFSASFSVEVAADHAEVPVITAQPSDHSLEPGESAVLTVSASVSDGGTLSYQWFSGSSASPENMAPCPAPAGAAPSFTAGELPPGDTYYCVRVTNTLGTQTASVFSLAALVRVMPGKPVITEQPAAHRVKVNESCTLSVTAAEPGSEGLSYLWYSGSVSDVGAMTAMDRGTRTGRTLTVDTSEPGTRYYCVLVMNTASGLTSSVYSRVVAVQVEAPVVSGGVSPSGTPMPAAVPIPEASPEEENEKRPEPTAAAPHIPGVTPTEAPAAQPARKSHPHIGTWIAVIAALTAAGAGGAYWYLGRREEDDE